MDQQIDKKSLEQALSDIRKDIAWLHKDLAYIERDKGRRIFIIMSLASSIVLNEAFALGMMQSLFWAVVIVSVYRAIEVSLIHSRARKLLKEPLEPEFNTSVDLSKQ
jgi:hypothetical protein